MLVCSLSNPDFVIPAKAGTPLSFERASQGVMA